MFHFQKDATKLALRIFFFNKMAKPHIAVVLVTQDIAFFSLTFVLQVNPNLSNFSKGQSLKMQQIYFNFCEKCCHRRKKIIGLLGNIQVKLDCYHEMQH